MLVFREPRFKHIAFARFYGNTQTKSCFFLEGKLLSLKGLGQTAQEMSHNSGFV